MCAQAKQLYRAFYYWRAELYKDLRHMELAYLRAITGDMRQALVHLEAEIARRTGD